MVFDKQWFELHQSKLLMLSNHFVLKYWFRRVLRINKDLKWAESVKKLAPNNFEVSLGTFLEKKELAERIRADFRTNDKFSARLYHAFRPMWWTMHFMDWAFFERTPLLHNLDFGFNTLTAYPEPGTTDDGAVARESVGGGFPSEAWSAIRLGAGSEIVRTQVQNFAWKLQFDSSGSQYVRLSRSMYCFDTSSIGTNSTISSEVLSLFGTSKSNGGGDGDIHIVSGAPSSTAVLSGSDYDIAKFGSTSYANTVYNNWYPRFTTDVQYNNFTLNADGRANIEKTGITTYGARCHWDIDGTTTGQIGGSSATAQMSVNFSNETGTTKDPKLVVVYTVYVVVKTLDETLSSTDSLGKSIAKSMVEIMTLTASLLSSLLKVISTKYFGNYATGGASVAQYPVADGLRVKGHSLIISEALSLIDGVSRFFSRTWAEAVSLVDSVTAFSLKFLSLSEILTITDSVVKSFSKALSEALVISDNFVRIICLFLSEALSLADSFATQVVRILTIIENIVVTGSFSKIPAKIWDEFMTLTSAFPLICVKIWDEAVVLSDSFAKIFTKILILTESVFIDEALFLNGVLASLWERATVAAATWSRTATAVSSWIRQRLP